MKKFFLLVVGMTVLLSSCGGNSAEKLNETIVAGVDGAVEKMDMVADLMADDDYEKALAYLDSTTAFVSEYNQKISALNNKSGEEFKQASIEFLTLIETEAVPVYRSSIEQYKIADANEDYEAVLKQYEKIGKVLDDMYTKLQEKQNALQTAQVAFAAKINMTLE